MSARENLTLGRADATEDEIAEALDDRPGRLRPRPAVGARHPDRRAGHVAVRRPAAAARAGPRRARPAEGPGARRHAVRARRPHREARRGGAAPGAAPTPPASSSPTAPPPCCSPTGSRCSRTARSPTSATHRELLATVPGVPRAARRRRRGPRGGRPHERRRRRPPAPTPRPAPDGTDGAGAASPPTDRRRPDRRDRRRCCADAVPAAARRPAAPVPAACSGSLIVVVAGRERRPALDPATWSRRASTAASRRSQADGDLEPLLDDRRRCVLAATIAPGGHAGSVFLVRSGPDRPGHALRAPAPGLPALPAPEPGLPRRATPRAGSISRQTSDVDAIYEMLETGFDGLVTAALTLVGTAVLLLVPRRQARPGRAALLPVPAAADANWFRKAVRARPTGVTREKVALVIVHFVESMSGIRAVQAFRREPRNQEIFDDVNDQYRAANLRAFRLVACVHAGHPADRQHHHRASCCSTAATSPITARSPSACSPRSCSTCGSSSSRCRRSRSSTTPSSRPAPALEKLSGVLEEEPGVPEPTRPGRRCRDARGEVALRRASASTTSTGVPVLPDLDLDRPGRADGRAGRHHRRRQDHDRQAARPVLRPDRRAGCCSTASTCATLDEPTLRRAVVMVTQENYLFAGTVADNIRFGRPERRPWSEVDGGRPGDRRARVHHRAAARATTPTSPTAAAGCRPGSASWSRSPGRSWPTRRADPRRGDLVARRTLRAAGAARAAHDPRRPHRGDHRPPALHGGDRRPGAGARARPDRRGRLAAGPHRRRGGGRFSDLHQAWLESLA